MNMTATFLNIMISCSLGTSRLVAKISAQGHETPSMAKHTIVNRVSNHSLLVQMHEERLLRYTEGFIVVYCIEVIR